MQAPACPTSTAQRARPTLPNKQRMHDSMQFPRCHCCANYCEKNLPMMDDDSIISRLIEIVVPAAANCSNSHLCPSSGRSATLD